MARAGRPTTSRSRLRIVTDVEIGLRKSIGIKLSEWRWLKVYLVLILGVYISFALVFLLVVKLSFTSLNIGQTFPVVAVPLKRRLFGNRKDGLITVTCAE